MPDLEENLKRVASFFKGNFVVRENLVIKGKKCRYAFYTYDGKFLMLAVTADTYNKYADQIEAVRKKALEEKREKELERNWITQALTGNVLYQSSFSWETGITGYKLVARVPKDVWNLIKHHFFFLSREEEEIEGESGWATTHVKDVTKIVLAEAKKRATEEHIRCAEKLKQKREESKRLSEKLSALKKEQRAKLAIIEKAFANAEIPDPRKEAPEEASKYQKGYEKMRVEGERIDDPFHPENIYGGGRWFILQPKKWIWLIQNNGSDGSNWSWNNVETGGAGAIGKRIPWDEKTAELIRSLM